MSTEAREKAKELIDKMYAVHSNSVSEITFYFAKQCALVAVDEIIKIIPKNNGWESTLDYWKEVREEIENYEMPQL